MQQFYVRQDTLNQGTLNQDAVPYANSQAKESQYHCNGKYTSEKASVSSKKLILCNLYTIKRALLQFSYTKVCSLMPACSGIVDGQRAY